MAQACPGSRVALRGGKGADQRLVDDRAGAGPQVMTTGTRSCGGLPTTTCCHTERPGLKGCRGPQTLRVSPGHRWPRIGALRPMAQTDSGDTRTSQGAGPREHEASEGGPLSREPVPHWVTPACAFNLKIISIRGMRPATETFNSPRIDATPTFVDTGI